MEQNPKAPFTASTTSGANSRPSESRDEAALAFKESITEGVRDLKMDVTHIATDVADDARKTAENRLSGGKDRAAAGLGIIANTLRHTGERLRSEDKIGLTDYVLRAANRVEAASDYLQTRTLGQIVDDAQEFGRREPALILGGAFVAGLLGGRFLKSSHPQQRHDDRSWGGDQNRAPQGPTRMGQGRSEEQRAPRSSRSPSPESNEASDRGRFEGDEERSPHELEASGDPGMPTTDRWPNGAGENAPGTHGAV